MEVSSAYKQAMASHHPLEQILTNPCIGTHQHLQSHHHHHQQQQQQHHQHQQQQQEKKPRPHQEQALRCPRCDSTNTKFCYYNNYSLSQPRYFCKGCRRYWTQGGSLRNVPVGGGCRKNKKPSSCSTSSSSSSRKPQAPIALLPPLPPPPPPTLSYDNNDLTLGFAPFLLENPNPNPNPDSSHVSGFLDILRSGLLDNGTAPICFGFGGNVQDMVLPFEGGGLVGASATTSSTTTTTNKNNNSNNNEMNKLMDGDESKVLIGVPWHVGGDVSLGLDNGKDCWNGVGSSWHGVINSSLL